MHKKFEITKGTTLGNTDARVLRVDWMFVRLAILREERCLECIWKMLLEASFAVLVVAAIGARAQLDRLAQLVCCPQVKLIRDFRFDS